MRRGIFFFITLFQRQLHPDQGLLLGEAGVLDGSVELVGGVVQGEGAAGGSVVADVLEQGAYRQRIGFLRGCQPEQVGVRAGGLPGGGSSQLTFLEDRPLADVNVEAKAHESAQQTRTQRLEVKGYVPGKLRRVAAQQPGADLRPVCA